LNRTQSLTIGFVCIICVAIVAHHLPIVEQLNYAVLDQQFSYLKQDSTKSEIQRIVIVGIDENSFSVFPEPLALWHKQLGKLFSALSISGPVAVGLDIVLPEKSYAFINQQYDRDLLLGLRDLSKTTPVFIAQSLNDYKSFKPLFPPIISIAGSNSASHALLKFDSDGVIRQLPVSLSADNSEINPISANLAKVSGYKTPGGLIDYSSGTRFDYIPIQDVITLFESNDSDLLDSFFRDKYVLIGSVLPFSDRLRVPIPLFNNESINTNVPGVMIHAQILRTWINSVVVKPVDALILFCLFILISCTWWITRSTELAITYLVLLVLILWFVSRVSLEAGIYLPVASLFITGFLAIVGRTGLEAAWSRRDKKFLQDSFSGYVSPSVLNDILKKKIVPGVGGEHYEVAVLFSDIRDFTSRCEGQPPESIIDLLNDYFNEMATSVHEFNGTVDKYIGDGMMAFFGAPANSANPCQDALDAAKDMLKRLDSVNSKLRKNHIEPISIGIGLHFGGAIIGHVGSAQRHEYTAIGDTVNISARLESLTKNLGYAIACSQNFYEQLCESSDVIDLGMHSIKGRSDIHVYGYSEKSGK